MAIWAVLRRGQLTQLALAFLQLHSSALDRGHHTTVILEAATELLQIIWNTNQKQGNGAEGKETV